MKLKKFSFLLSAASIVAAVPLLSAACAQVSDSEAVQVELNKITGAVFDGNEADKARILATNVVAGQIKLMAGDTEFKLKPESGLSLNLLLEGSNINGTLRVSVTVQKGDQKATTRQPLLITGFKKVAPLTNSQLKELLSGKLLTRTNFPNEEGASVKLTYATATPDTLPTELRALIASNDVAQRNQALAKLKLELTKSATQKALTEVFPSLGEPQYEVSGPANDPEGELKLKVTLKSENNFATEEMVVGNLQKLSDRNKIKANTEANELIALTPILQSESTWLNVADFITQYNSDEKLKQAFTFEKLPKNYQVEFIGQATPGKDNGTVSLKFVVKYQEQVSSENSVLFTVPLAKETDVQAQLDLIQYIDYEVNGTRTKALLPSNANNKNFVALTADKSAYKTPTSTWKIAFTALEPNNDLGTLKVKVTLTLGKISREKTIEVEGFNTLLNEEVDTKITSVHYPNKTNVLPSAVDRNKFQAQAGTNAYTPTSSDVTVSYVIIPGSDNDVAGTIKVKVILENTKTKKLLKKLLMLKVSRPHKTSLTTKWQILPAHKLVTKKIFCQVIFKNWTPKLSKLEYSLVIKFHWARKLLMQLFLTQ
ncbi:lipoprotein 17-related variable surface protein [Mycoplasmopsis columbinasalis]|uniref:Lipoprotein associated domain n=1 Tax=Mycoplasmopsis columbinasalis TaxID=114880 RepID=A0A449B9I3_9BACT|nr:lipoprotein 17-related variable surface protein [Mycoplasmopsis columbinasalis]VEU77841.1 Lipoprotein associated domain [Mycoplasmopsis columbinasalis]